MKHFNLTFVLIFLFISCSPKMATPSVFYTVGTFASTDFPASGNELRDVWQGDIINTVNTTFDAAKASKRIGILTVGIGSVGTVVNTQLSDSDAKNVGFAVTLTSTVLGIVQLLFSQDKDAENYVNDSRKALYTWDISTHDEAAYIALRNAITDAAIKYKPYGNFSIPAPKP